MSEANCDYTIKKECPNSEPSILFQDSRLLAVLAIIIGPVLLFFGIATQFETDCIHQAASAAHRASCHMTGHYTWSKNEFLSMFFGAFGILGLVMLVKGFRVLSNPAIIGLYVEGIWLLGIGLVPWEAMIGAEGTTRAYQGRYQKDNVTSYNIFFKRPKNLKNIPLIRRFFIRNSEGPLKISFSGLPLNKSKSNGLIVWSPEIVASLINQCACASETPDKIRTYLNNPQYDASATTIERKKLIESLKQRINLRERMSPPSIDSSLFTFKSSDSNFSARARKLLNAIAREPLVYTQLFYAVLSIVFSIFTFYTISDPTFFPSKAWDHLSKTMAIAAVGIPAGFFCKVALSGKLSTAQPGSTISKFILFMGFFWLITWTGFELGFAHIGTEIIGTEYSQVVSATKNTRHHGGGGKYNSGPFRDCFDTPVLPQSDFSEICIPEDQLRNAAPQVSLRLAGKQSWFGFAVNRYQILPSQQN